jgi:hypothetical protein
MVILTELGLKPVQQALDITTCMLYTTFQGRGMPSIPLNFTRHLREIAPLMFFSMVSRKNPGEKLKNGSSY